jgi:hypothetical protein
MKSIKNKATLENMIGPLGECLTPEVARRVVMLKADPKLQARVNYLAGQCNEGLLTTEEKAEYSSYVSFGTFVAILKSKARQLLVQHTSE